MSSEGKDCSSKASVATFRDWPSPCFYFLVLLNLKDKLDQFGKLNTVKELALRDKELVNTPKAV